MFKSFFDPDNLFFSSISTLVDIVGLSVLWAFLCLPVVTIVPATAALYFTVYKVFRCQDQTAFRTYLRSFLGCLKNGILANVCLLPIVVLFYILYLFYGLAADTLGVMGQMAYAYYYVILLIPIGFVCWLVALLGRFEFSFKALLSTAFRMMISYLPVTVLLLLVTAAAYLSVVKVPMMLFAVPTFWGIMCSYPLEKAFARHMPDSDTP